MDLVKISWNINNSNFFNIIINRANIFIVHKCNITLERHPWYIQCKVKWCHTFGLSRFLFLFSLFSIVINSYMHCQFCKSLSNSSTIFFEKSFFNFKKYNSGHIVYILDDLDEEKKVDITQTSSDNELSHHYK